MSVKPPPLAIHNKSPLPLRLRLEPEGDYVIVRPGGKCDILTPTGDPASLHLEYEPENVLAIWADEFKTVVVDGITVRE